MVLVIVVVVGVIVGDVHVIACHYWRCFRVVVLVVDVVLWVEVQAPVGAEWTMAT